MPVDHQAAAGPGAKDDAEHEPVSLSGAVPGLGQREAVRVVLQPDRPIEHAFQIVPQRTPDEPDRIGVLDQPGGGRQDPRHADADRCRVSDTLFQPLDQPGNGDERPLIVVPWCRHTMPGQDDPVRGQGGGLDLGPTQVDADPGGTNGCGFGHASVDILAAARYMAQTTVGTPACQI